MGSCAFRLAVEADCRTIHTDTESDITPLSRGYNFRTVINESATQTSRCFDTANIWRERKHLHLEREKGVPTILKRRGLRGPISRKFVIQWSAVAVKCAARKLWNSDWTGSEKSSERQIEKRSESFEFGRIGDENSSDGTSEFSSFLSKEPYKKHSGEVPGFRSLAIRRLLSRAVERRTTKSLEILREFNLF